MSKREQAIENAAYEKAALLLINETKIPQGARNPTRDFKVVLGEELAARIRWLKRDTEALFYILSAYHSRPRDGMLTWWGPESCGYVFDLNRAGKYSEEESRHIVSERNIAIPCELADAACQRVFIWEPHLYAALGDDVAKAIKKGSR